jgi:phosphoribosylformylglycinamidine (FGAM) synthase PurS component
VLDQLKEDVDKLKKKKIKSSINSEISNIEQQQVPSSTTIVESINEIELINPVVENFEFHVTHSIKCTQ